MVGVLQRFCECGNSKSVNVPDHITPEGISDIYERGVGKRCQSDLDLSWRFKTRRELNLPWQKIKESAANNKTFSLWRRMNDQAELAKKNSTR